MFITTHQTLREVMKLMFFVCSSWTMFTILNAFVVVYRTQSCSYMPWEGTEPFRISSYVHICQDILGVRDVSTHFDSLHHRAWGTLRKHSGIPQISWESRKEPYLMILSLVCTSVTSERWCHCSFQSRYDRGGDVSNLSGGFKCYSRRCSRFIGCNVLLDKLMGSDVYVTPLNGFWNLCGAS